VASGEWLAARTDLLRGTPNVGSGLVPNDRDEAKVRRRGNGVLVAVRKCLFLCCEGVAAIFECGVVAISRHSGQGFCFAPAGKAVASGEWLVATRQWRVRFGFVEAIFIPPTLRLLEWVAGECFQSFASISNRVPVIRIWPFRGQSSLDFVPALLRERRLACSIRHTSSVAPGRRAHTFNYKVILLFNALYHIGR
jgi:hypothetical protein